MIRAWIESGTVVKAGGSIVGTGTWKVVRGTGRYVQVTGSGRSRYVYLGIGGPGHWSSRNEGFLTLP